MEYRLDGRAWFVILQRLPRPLLTLSLCTATAFYAWRAALGHPIDIAVFAALGTATGVDVIRRGAEKFGARKVEAEAAVESLRALPAAKPEGALVPDLPAEELP